MYTIRAILAAFALTLVSLGSALAAELVMVEQRGCIYCERWHADVGPEYPKTAEGRFAPVRMIDLPKPIPEDLTFTGPPL